MKRVSDHPAGNALCWAAFLLCAAAQAAEPDGAAWFETKIRPLLVERCYECHGPKKQKGGLRLDSKAAWQKGGENGEVITPGDPEASPLIKAVRYADKDLQMPPKRQLAPEEIAALEQWVKMGAPDPRIGPPAVSTKKDKPDPREHWAFKRPQRTPPPKVAHDSAARSDIDRFVLARLEKEGFTPSPEASRSRLVRRLSLDLIGLPPSPAEVNEFVADRRADRGVR